MRALLLAVVGGIAMGGFAVWAVMRHEDSVVVARAEGGETPVKARTVTLRPEQQTKAGIVAETLTPQELPAETRGYGQVIDPQPLLDLLSELRTGEAALDASAKEYLRVQALHANDQNASARAVEGAAAAMKRDQLQVDVSRSKLLNALGTSLGARADVDRIVHSLVALDAALIRIDLPLGNSLPAPPASARVLSPTDPVRSAQARYVGPARAAIALAPGQSYMFLLESNSLELRPEMGVIAFLEMRSRQTRGLVLPRSAIVRHDAQAWIYVRSEDQVFVRTPVVLDRATENGWFVAGLEPGGPVVVAGAQTLLSEELKSQIHLAD